MSTTKSALRQRGGNPHETAIGGVFEYKRRDSVRAATRISGVPEADDELVDTHTAARMMGLAYQTVACARVYGGAGACPYYKIGRLVRYSVREIKKYLLMNMTRSTSEHYAAK